MVDGLAFEIRGKTDDYIVVYDKNGYYKKPQWICDCPHYYYNTTLGDPSTNDFKCKHIKECIRYLRRCGLNGF